MSPSSTPKARLAHEVVRLAIKSGEKPCEVCGENRPMWVVAHHENYDKPPDVRWLCNSHHMQLHASRRFKLTDMLLTYKGETLSIADWAKRAGLSAAALYGRIFLLGWPVVMALNLRSFAKSPHKLSRRVLRATRASALNTSSTTNFPKRITKQPAQPANKSFRRLIKK